LDLMPAVAAFGRSWPPPQPSATR